jgi:hypothetical protein
MEIRDDIHEAFLRFACAIICWRRLHNISNLLGVLRGVPGETLVDLIAGEPEVR